MNSKTRPAAILGGNRIPFARSNGPYARASNQDMLTAAIDGLVERTGIGGERLGEVAAGAVLKHSRDFNLTRESVLGTKLAPETPAYDVGQACGTGLETVILTADFVLGNISVINIGTATGTDVGGVTVSDDDDAEVTVVLGEIIKRELPKTGSGFAGADLGMVFLGLGLALTAIARRRQRTIAELVEVEEEL